MSWSINDCQAEAILKMAKKFEKGEIISDELVRFCLKDEFVVEALSLDEMNALHKERKKKKA